MKIKESSIEEKIRVNTPDYVYGVSENISRYGCEFFSIHVRFKDGFTVHKGVDVNGVSEHMSGVPDFILLNRQDKEAVDSLCSAFEAGGIVEYTLNDYFCSRNGLYFIEAFGDYWHGKEITGIEMDEHENEVRLAYENAGHHVLILWEHDIVNSWNEKCLPLIRQFIDEFIADGNELPGDSVVSNEKSDVLSDEAVRAMHDVEYRSGLSDDEIDSLSNEVAGFYERHGVFDVNRYDAMLDYAKINKWAENGSFVNVTRFGKIFPWYLFGSLKHRIKNADGMSLYEFVSGKKAPLSNAVLSLMKSNNDVNMLSVLETHAGMNGFHDGMPFDFSEVLLRISHMDIERKDVFFDPACNCGETMYAAKMAGFKKYVGFVESRDRKEELLRFAEFIGYGNVSMYVVDYDSRMAFLTVLRPGMFTFTCCDDIGKLVKLSWMAENDHSFLVNTSLKDFRVISDSIDIVKMDYWRRNGIVKDWIYSFMKTDKYNRVRCLECGVSFSGLRGHALDSHGITTEQYVERHPGAQVTSLAEHDKIVHANQMKCRDGKRKYQKRNVYLLPDGGYASKADQYRRAWGVDEIKPEHVIDASTIQYVPNYAKNEELGIEGEDYVVCAICNEKKGSLTQHLRKEHNMTPDEYEKEYGLPVHSRKNQEAFHQCAVNKWKTQFGTGQSVHAAPRARVENPVNRKRDDITAEMILEQLAVGNGIAEMTEKFKCSDVTLVKYMREQGVEMPSRTVLAIRRAVHGGAERDMEHVGLDVIEMLLSDHGKEKTMQMFGVKRTVFDTWLSELRRKKEGGKSVEPAIEEAPKPAAEEKPAPPLINSDGSVQPSLFDDDDALKGNEVETLVSRFRGFGFPYPSYSDREAVDTIEKINGTRQMISDDGAIAQGATAGNDWLLSFFPNFFECRQNGKKSAVWMYENKLEHIVKDMLKYSPGKDMTNALLRSYLMEHERVSGFRPVIAKQIYDRHCQDGAVVLDPCGGWGGRMLGAYCSDKVARYDCVDASSRTCDGLAKLSGELDRLYRKKETHVVHGAFEDLDVSDCFYDVVFTSTPYFTKELYSNDEEQSCNRYPEYNEWIAGFMRPFVMKSFRCLRPGGKFIVNIDDVRIKDVSNPLKSDFERIACEAGFRLVETMHMDYHNRYTGKEHGEPIYVMEKPVID